MFPVRAKPEQVSLHNAPPTMRPETKPPPRGRIAVTMHQLLLLRHAKSLSEDTSIPDRNRPLNPRGRRAAVAMRRTMRELGLAPDLILVSSATRTMETMSLLEPWDDTPLIEPMDELYLASARRLLATLRDVAETVRTVLLIGHNPGLHDLAVLLADPQASAAKPLHMVREGFPTGALAEFTVTGPWSRLGAGGGRLMRFLTPRMLEAADHG
jgi:phosphohistidine phosphatase